MTTKLRAASFQDGAVTNAKLAGSIATAKLVQGSSFLTSMPAGSIIQVQHVKTNTKTTTTSGTMGDATNLTLSFTPLSASSTLKITALVSFKQQKTSSSHAGGSYTILHDGSILDANPAEYEHFSEVNGGGATEINNYMRSSKVAFVSASNTNARTIKVQLKSFSSSSATINWASSFYSFIVVEEIKG